MNISIIKSKRATGFSLTEMLIATGIMAIGLVMVATVFPVGIKLTSLSTERSVGSIVADEAFAKVKLYGLRDFIDWPQTLVNAPGYPLAQAAEATYDGQSDFLYTSHGVLFPTDAQYGNADDFYVWHPGPNGTFNGGGDDIVDTTGLFLSESRYPSTAIPTGENYRYHWSALCRRVGLKDVQVTVFVTRKALGGITYYNYPFDYSGVGRYLRSSDAAWPPDDSIWPEPVKVQMLFVNSRTLQIDTTSDWSTTALAFFDEGYTIVEDRTGTINRVFEMKDVYPTGAPDGLNEVILWEDWHDNTAVLGNTINVWLVPPGVGSNRYPCIGVYQKIIRFDDIN